MSRWVFLWNYNNQKLEQTVIWYVKAKEIYHKKYGEGLSSQTQTTIIYAVDFLPS